MFSAARNELSRFKLDIRRNMARYVKNHKMLIEAFSIFEKRFPMYTLHFYGKGPLEADLKNYAIKLGVLNKIVFHGFTNRVDEKIRHSGMFVLSSNYEGISNSMIEALALGLPVISTDCPIGGSKMYIEDGVNGLLVPVGNCEKLAEAMGKIAEDTKLTQKMSENAQKVRVNYSIRRIADLMLEAAKY